MTDFSSEFGHLSNTSGIVGDRAVGVNGESNAEGTKHSNGGQGDSEESTESDGGHNGGGEEEDGDDGTQVTEGKSVDDVDSASGGAGLGHLLHRVVSVGGIVVGGKTDEET